jgi:hypothetical protein
VSRLKKPPDRSTPLPTSRASRTASEPRRPSLLPNQTKRLARRPSLGLPPGSIETLSMLSNYALGPIFDATVQATGEAIANAFVAAQDMTGVDGDTVAALPHDALQQALKKYNRAASTS